MAAVSFTGSRCALRRDAAVATSVVGSTPRLVAFRRLAHGDASTSTSLPERRPQVVVKASANGSEDAAVSRRQALSAAAVASLLAMNPGEAKAIRTTSMGTHENGDPVVSEWNEYKGRPGAASTYQANVEHRAAFSTIVADKVKDAIKPAEAAAVLKLAFLDASTYKPVNWATYGVNGSIRFEKGLMEKEGVAGVFAKLEKVKADVDSAYASYAKDQQARLGDSASPAPDKISYADLIAMSAAVAVEQKWVSERGEVDEALALHWPQRQGRKDANAEDPSERALDLVALGPADARAALKLANMNIYDFALLCKEMMGDDAAAYCAKDKDVATAYKSIAALSRRNYEKQFIDMFTRLASLGADYDAFAYLFDMKDPSRTTKGYGGL